MSLDLGFMLTPWELKELVCSLRTMAIVTYVTYMSAVRSNYAHLFFGASPQTRISLGASGFY